MADALLFLAQLEPALEVERVAIEARVGMTPGLEAAVAANVTLEPL